MTAEPDHFMLIAFQTSLGDILPQLGWVDGAAFIFIAAAAAGGAFGGAFAEFIALLRMIIVILLTGAAEVRLEAWILKYAQVIPAQFSGASAFFILACLLWLISGFLLRRARKFFQIEFAPPIRAVGGTILGAVRGLIVLSFICQPILRLPLAQTQKLFLPGESYSGPLVAHTSPAILRFLSEPQKVFSSGEIGA
ncbi:MAG: hypothetical protein FGM27_03715 [Candidatus Omnitrophica bacterium]|nr:hypothetical protein [Candidatus Omnitrophota bacterium]